MSLSGKVFTEKPTLVARLEVLMPFSIRLVDQHEALSQHCRHPDVPRKEEQPIRERLVADSRNCMNVQFSPHPEFRHFGDNARQHSPGEFQ